MPWMPCQTSQNTRQRSRPAAAPSCTLPRPLLQGRLNAAQLQKLEALHSKQQAVLRRKTEEAEAARRRLKEMEDRQQRLAHARPGTAAAAAAAPAAERPFTAPAAGGAAGHPPRPPTGAGVERSAASASAAPGSAAAAATAEQEVQPNAMAPLLRDERSRREWMEAELDAYCSSYELQVRWAGVGARRAGRPRLSCALGASAAPVQRITRAARQSRGRKEGRRAELPSPPLAHLARPQKVAEGERAQRSECQRKLREVERALAALRNPEWWGAATGLVRCALGAAGGLVGACAQSQPLRRIPLGPADLPVTCLPALALRAPLPPVPAAPAAPARRSCWPARRRCWRRASCTARRLRRRRPACWRRARRRRRAAACRVRTAGGVHGRDDRWPVAGLHLGLDGVLLLACGQTTAPALPLSPRPPTQPTPSAGTACARWCRRARCSRRSSAPPASTRRRCAGGRGGGGGRQGAGGTTAASVHT